MLGRSFLLELILLDICVLYCDPPCHWWQGCLLCGGWWHPGDTEWCGRTFLLCWSWCCDTWAAPRMRCNWRQVRRRDNLVTTAPHSWHRDNSPHEPANTSHRATAELSHSNIITTTRPEHLVLASLENLIIHSGRAAPVHSQPSIWSKHCPLFCYQRRI